MDIVKIVEIILAMLLIIGWIIRIKRTPLVKESFFRKFLIACLHGLEVLQLLLLFGFLEIFFGNPCADSAPSTACGDLVGFIAIPFLLFSSFIVGMLCFAGYGYFRKHNRFDTLGLLFLIFYASPLFIFAFFLLDVIGWFKCTFEHLPWYCH